jgi:hypothetical protein
MLLHPSFSLSLAVGVSGATMTGPFFAVEEAFLVPLSTGITLGLGFAVVHRSISRRRVKESTSIAWVRPNKAIT